MQRRFCSCGHVVFVRYRSRNGMWQPQLLVKNHACTHIHTKSATCPGCGSPLSIHALR